MKLLVDDDIRRLADPATTRTAMRAAIIAAHRGELLAPPRAGVELGDQGLSFTCGARTGEWFGYRWPAPNRGSSTPSPSQRESAPLGSPRGGPAVE